MFGKKLAGLVLVGVSFCCLVGAFQLQSENKILKWTDVQKVDLANLEPAGSEMNQLNPTIYVARIFHQGGVIPGKYVDKRSMCYYTDNGTWHETRQCEVLVYLRGLVSWVPVENMRSFDNVIIGGIDPRTNQVLRICRLEHEVKGEKHLMPGKMTPSGNCIGVYYGDVTKNSNFEVLVINAYGKFISK